MKRTESLDSLRLDALLNAGRVLSHLAFNLGQGRSLTPSERETAAVLARAWDMAAREVRKGRQTIGVTRTALAELRREVLRSVDDAFARVDVAPRKRARKEPKR